MTPQHLILNARVVGELNWQPRVCPAPLACIASRRGDVLELIFGLGYDPASQGRITAPRHHYRLEPLTDRTVLATLIDGEEVSGLA